MNKEEKEIMNKMIYCNLINGDQAIRFNRHIEEMQQEIERLNNIINELEKNAKEIVRVGKNRGYQYIENILELKTKEEMYNFIEFYYALYLLEELEKLKELKEGK